MTCNLTRCPDCGGTTYSYTAPGEPDVLVQCNDCGWFVLRPQARKRSRAFYNYSAADVQAAEDAHYNAGHPTSL